MQQLDFYEQYIYDVNMRTTINIGDDLMGLLKRKALFEKKSLTQTVNELLETGLCPGKDNLGHFVQEAFPMGTHPSLDLNKALDLAAELETKYSIDKMELGK